MINITRDSGYADKLRNYKLFLDGKIIGEIADGENKSFKVTPGEHVLYAAIDYIKSNRVSFTSNNKTVSFECRNTLRGNRYFLLPLYLTSLKSKYLTLRKV